jgi:hypothetical protein
MGCFEDRDVLATIGPVDAAIAGTDPDGSAPRRRPRDGRGDGSTSINGPAIATEA